LKLYKILIKPMVKYSSETCTWFDRAKKKKRRNSLVILWHLTGHAVYIYKNKKKKYWYM